jgi:hypothetical protein
LLQFLRVIHLDQSKHRPDTSQLNTAAIMGSPEIKEGTAVTSGTDISEKKTMAINDQQDVGHVERVLSGEENLKDHMNYDRVDAEVAKYTSNIRTHISEEESTRLRKLIDKRVLSIMIFTYFLQALDKGTLSFASVMGIQDDAHLVAQEVCFDSDLLLIAFPLRPLANMDSELVLLAHNWYLHGYSRR